MNNPDIQLDICGDNHEVAVIRLTRPTKRNALNDVLVITIRDTFDTLPASVRAAVITGDGDHFCAGLDLSELKERDAGQGLHHSRMWHAALERVQHGTVPVIAALHGAVVGAGAWQIRRVRRAENASWYHPERHRFSDLTGDSHFNRLQLARLKPELEQAGTAVFD